MRQGQECKVHILEQERISHNPKKIERGRKQFSCFCWLCVLLLQSLSCTYYKRCAFGSYRLCSAISQPCTFNVPESIVCLNGCVCVIRCIRHSPDEDGVDGIYLGKDVVTEASRGLSKALTIIAARVLDIGQILQYICTQMIRRWVPRVPEFSPSFGKCLDHVLIHAGTNICWAWGSRLSKQSDCG